MSLTRVDLPGPRHPGDRGEAAERELDVDALQVVLAGPPHDERLVGRLAAQRGDRDGALARQVLPGDRGLRPEQPLHRALVDDAAPVLAGAGTDVDHVVADPDGVLVVLDDQHRVAEVAEALERLDQSAVVSLVQADRRLVEHVEHPDQAAADLRGQADALRLATGEGGRRAREVEVIEPDVEQETHPGVDLLHHAIGDHVVALGQGERLERLGRVTDRHERDVGDAVAVDGDGQRQRLEPGAAALGARHLAHVALDLLALGVALGLGVPALQVGDDALELGVVAAAAAVAVLVLHLHPAGDAVEQQLLLGLGQLLPGHVVGDVVVGADRFEQAGEVLRAPAAPRRDGPFADGERRVGDDELGIDLEPGAETVAVLARAVGRVEREVAGSQLLVGATALGAGQVLAEGERLGLGLVAPGDDVDLGDAVREAQRGLERIGQATVDALPLDEPVDDDLDGVLLVAGQLDLVGELVELSVDPGPGEALGGEVGEERVVGALAAPHHRCQHLEAGALGQQQDAVDDLLGRLAGDGRAVDRAVRDADAGVEQAEVVVDLGDGADGRAGVARGALLVDGDGRRQPFDEVDVGLVHLAEELAGVGRERLDVAALALGVDGVERQGGLSGARETREHDELVAWELERDVAQVVLSGPADGDGVGHGAKPTGVPQLEHVFR